MFAIHSRFWTMCAVYIVWSTPSFAQSSDFSRFGLEVEGGPAWITRNDVRIPPVGGTEFALTDLIGTGPSGYVRGYANIQLANKHSLRLLAAPFRTSATGFLIEPVFFVDETFDPGLETEGIYQFSTYRFTYGYSLVDGENWLFKIGASGLIRDAKIELRQGAKTASDDDLGFVPLAFLRLRRDLGDRTYVAFDVEGLGSPQGRAIDASAKLHYEMTEKLNLGFGYRTIEGGADVDTVFNFAWLHFAAISIGYDF